MFHIFLYTRVKDRFCGIVLAKYLIVLGKGIQNVYFIVGLKKLYALGVINRSTPAISTILKIDLIEQNERLRRKKTRLY